MTALFVPKTFPVPQGFVPTAPMSVRWAGKVRCAFCEHSGWPDSSDGNPRWWGHRHGHNCQAAKQ